MCSALANSWNSSHASPFSSPSVVQSNVADEACTVVNVPLVAVLSLSLPTPCTSVCQISPEGLGACSTTDGARPLEHLKWLCVSSTHVVLISSEV